MYKIFRIPKKNGFRQVEAPCDELKQKQKDSLKVLQRAYKVSPFAHAFQPYKNIATMSMHHVGKRWIGKMDVKDFFPSITMEMFLKSCNIKEQGEKAPDDILAVNFYDFSDGKGLRLPQGAPASPFLSNAFLFRADWILAWKARDFNCSYSRYADDLVFSGDSSTDVWVMLTIAKNVLKEMGLRINNKKTSVKHNRQRQKVCGIVVNKKVNLPRKFRKNLRAEIFQQKGEPLRADTKGRIAFAKMVMENNKQSFSNIAIVNSIVFARMLDGVDG